MPQSTLKAYFATVQPVSAPQPVPVSSFPTLVSHNVVSVAQDAKDITGHESSITGTILNSIAKDVFGGSQSDYFVPTHQPSAVIAKVLPSHLARLKSITSTLLPVRYPDSFYNECVNIESVSDLSRVLLWKSQPVGWIRCRLEQDDRGLVQVYIQALGVLGPYRGTGLGACLLKQAMQPQVMQKHDVRSVYCHVWESNEDALVWYEKRGFTRVILLERYYRRLKPSGAWVMRMEIT